MRVLLHLFTWVFGVGILTSCSTHRPTPPTAAIHPVKDEPAEVLARVAVLGSGFGVVSAPPHGVVVPSTNGLPPGVYEARPFACIVVVPDQNLDPGAVVLPGGPTSSMGVLEPELRLVPRGMR